MSRYTHQKEVDKGIKLGVKWSSKKDAEPTGVWYCYIYAYDPSQKKDMSDWRSTRVKYEDGRKANERKARRFAIALAEEIGDRIGKTENPFKKITVAEVAEEWIELVRKLTAENEKLKAAKKRPIHEVYGGKEGKTWDTAKIEHAVRFHGYLKDFWKTLPHQDITKITEEHLNKLMEWTKQFKWSPSHVKKLITQIRKIWLFARSKELVDFIPSIKAPAENAKLVSRRPLKQEEFERMFDYTRERYQQPKIPLRLRDAYLQFHCWLLICTHTGIRPPSHEKNAMRWKDYKKPKRKKGEPDLRYLRRENEKELDPYDAIILPNAFEAFEMLEKLYKERGMGKPEYLFTHTHDRKAGRNSSGHEKGNPVLCYHKQWQTMLIKLRLDTKETAQSERLAPYSMRGFFHTTLFDDYPELRIESIAEITGTSVRMLNQSYIDHSTEKTAKQIASSINWGKKR
jgi:hypothetical protein